MTSTEDPSRYSKNEQATNSNRSVVECVTSYWVGHRQGEEDWDCCHPKDRNPTNHDPITPQVERSGDEGLACQSHPEEDG